VMNSERESTVNLKYHYTPTPGYTQVVSPETHPSKDLDFGMLQLAEGQSYTSESGGYEIGLVILTGVCDITVGEQHFAALGGRTSVFAARATGVYIPCHTPFTVTAVSHGIDIAVCRCPTETAHPVRVIQPADVVVHDIGGAGYHRYVHDIFAANMEATTMIIGETFTIAGNWSSFPPHKHDQEVLPDEVQQAELYLYRIRPENGFGIQYFYTNADSSYGELDQAVAVHANDVTIMPFGYHPVAAPPGYDVYYLWFLSGPTRLLKPNDDPAHAWIKTAPDEQRDYPQ